MGPVMQMARHIALHHVGKKDDTVPGWAGKTCLYNNSKWGPLLNVKYAFDPLGKYYIFNDVENYFVKVHALGTHELKSSINVNHAVISGTIINGYEQRGLTFNTDFSEIRYSDKVPRLRLFNYTNDQLALYNSIRPEGEEVSNDQWHDDPLVFEPNEVVFYCS